MLHHYLTLATANNAHATVAAAAAESSPCRRDQPSVSGAVEVESPLSELVPGGAKAYPAHYDIKGRKAWDRYWA
jgi:hypothetical protein